VREHGLVPIPVELDLTSMSPSLDAVKEKVTEKTKACLFALLFGLRYDLAPYADYLDSKGIDIIEDVA
jgi:perosamine synthetase